MSLPGPTCKAIRTHNLKQGEVLFYEGSPAQEMFFIENGRLKITKRVLDKNIKLGELAEGEFVGELAVLGGELRSATAQAFTDCEIVALDRKTCQKCFDSLPACMHAMLEKLASRLRQADELVVKIARVHEMVKEMAMRMQLLESSVLEDRERGAET